MDDVLTKIGKLKCVTGKETLLQGLMCSDEDIQKVFSTYILSQSGWRHVFSKSGDEEDDTEEIKDEDKALAALIAKAYCDAIGAKGKKVLLGSDSRPTGRVLSDITLRVLLSIGAKVTYLSIASAPEIMAYSNDGFDSFFYISASHNPIGHNGFKFGKDGGVYTSLTLDGMLSILRDEIASGNICKKASEIERNLNCTLYAQTVNSMLENKKKSLAYYTDFVLKTASLPQSFTMHASILSDQNGSARTLSADSMLFQRIGVRFKAVNSDAGRVVHGIVPEGENLIPLSLELEKAHAMDESYVLGYTPDNDGDRGNFAYISDDGKSKVLEAQEVFALVFAIESASEAMKGEKNLAVAVNGPTSERVDEIARRLGVKVFRGEVGEANVVNLAEKLRRGGYGIRVLGEGSNGGNITYPAKVRDPLNTAMTFLKFLGDEKLYSFLLEKLGCKAEGKPSLGKLMEALPRYTTTPAFSPLAKLKVKHKDYRKLKENYEGLLLEEISSFSFFDSYKVLQTEGINEEEGIGVNHRTGLCKGGLKVVFMKDSEHVAYIWMRPSGTEPVLRVLVDVKGDNIPLHDRLLSWQRSLIERADNMASD